MNYYIEYQFVAFAESRIIALEYVEILYSPILLPSPFAPELSLTTSHVTLLSNDF